VKARKIGLLVLILCFGALSEISYNVRHELSFGPTGCRVLSGKFYGPSFDFESEERHAVSAPVSVEIDNAFGGVRVESGEPGEIRLALRTVVFLPTEEQARSVASRIELRTEDLGSTFKVATNRRAVAKDREEVGFETHLELVVPPDTVVRVRNEHGAVSVADVASADVESSYEPLRVERIAGGAQVRSRHGDIFVSAVKGSLSLHSRHGDVELEDVEGPSTLEVERGNVTGSRLGATELELSSGNLTAEQLSGNLRVVATHARIFASDVTGDADITTSYRDVELRRVGGEARVRADRGHVRLEAVGGAARAVTSYDGVSLSDMAGPVEVEVSHGGVEAQGLMAGASIKSAGDDVILRGFKGPLVVEARRGDVELVPEGPVTETISVSAPHGGISLQVTPGSRFELEILAAADQIDADVPGLSVIESGPRKLLGRVGDGGPSVELRAERGEVRLTTPSPARAEAE
jgi:hypothetical protein